MDVRQIANPSSENALTVLGLLHLLGVSQIPHRQPIIELTVLSLLHLLGVTQIPDRQPKVCGTIVRTNCGTNVYDHVDSCGLFINADSRADSPRPSTSTGGYTDARSSTYSHSQGCESPQQSSTDGIYMARMLAWIMSRMYYIGGIIADCAAAGVRCVQSVWAHLFKCKEGVEAIRNHEKALYDYNVRLMNLLLYVWNWWVSCVLCYQTLNLMWHFFVDCWTKEGWSLAARTHFVANGC